MISRYLAIILALIGSALFLTQKTATPPPRLPPFIQPAKNPYIHAISASGIIEAAEDNIPIGSPEPGLVKKTFVKVWQKVNINDPLFQLDTRELEAKLHIDQAKAQVASAKLQRLEDQLNRLKSIEDLRAVSIDELRTKENDVTVAENEYTQTLSEIESTEILIERMTIRAPRKGTIIQKNISTGEYLSLVPKNPAIILGDMTELQIRADIDEQNASLIVANAPATAFPKNNPDIPIPLKFVYVIPKKSLTGLGDERVDTRVLQVIYTFNPPENFNVYIGQQVDVFIEADNNNVKLGDQ
ncbi:efflux RND transporter periplasmic adaptor subunit [Chlamydiales bacterium]|nr:efflux RND transporter periplasmic adaptor subunit [Chlamydiales bacterium]